MRGAILTATAIVLWAVPAIGAERSDLVKARVFITGGVKSFRYQVSLSSKDPSHRVVSVLVGQRPGLREEPTLVSAPNGWQGRVLPRNRGGWVTWAVEVGCPEAGECGLRAGESLKFEFSLPYEAGELRTEPIYIVFSDGRTGLASW